MSETDKEVPAAQVTNFIRNIIEDDAKAGALENRFWCGRPGTYDLQAAGGPDAARIRTRFPPEPNGYLHIGHAKSICLNFGLAEDYGGFCHMRFDDTNPGKESDEYVQAIKESVSWLGFSWEHGKENNLYFASDYFETMYACAMHLIKAGLAYVDEQSPDAIRESRGTLHEPGKDSPFRNRPIEENVALFKAMRAGKCEEGSMVLRAKIDMASPNINMRDPAIYRIRFAEHHRTGSSWCIYPMYAFAHPIEDALECITHSVCTLEFEDQRLFYDWVVERCAPVLRAPQFERAKKLIAEMREGASPLAASFVKSTMSHVDKLGPSVPEQSLKDMLEGITNHEGKIELDNPLISSYWALLGTCPELFTPLLSAVLSEICEPNYFKLPHQHEFNRLNLGHVVVSKRKLIELVTQGLVDGWDDPRMPTIFGLRRRGYTPESLKLFAARCGVSRAAGGIISYSLLEQCLREDLEGKAPRRMAVVRPLKLVIDNYPEGTVETFEAPNHPQKPEMGARQVRFSKTLWIDAADFSLDPPKGYRRLAIADNPEESKPVRLRYAYVVRPVSVEKDAEGNPSVVHCVYYPETRSGSEGSDAVKTKAAIHWVDASSALKAQFRLYDRLFTVERPDAQATDFKTFVNAQSKEVVEGYVEASLSESAREDRFQFERTGYFVADREDFTPERPVFNLAVGLRDTWNPQR